MEIAITDSFSSHSGVSSHCLLLFFSIFIIFATSSFLSKFWRERVITMAIAQSKITRDRTHAPISKSSSDEARRRFDTKCSDSKLNHSWFSFLFLYLSPTNIDLDYRVIGGEIVKCQQSIKQFGITKIRSQHILYSEFSLS